MNATGASPQQPYNIQYKNMYVFKNIDNLKKARTDAAEPGEADLAGAASMPPSTSSYMQKQKKLRARERYEKYLMKP